MKRIIFAALFLFIGVGNLSAADAPKPSENTLIAAEIPPNFQPDVDPGPEEQDLIDPRVLRDFVESRGLIECRQKCGKLVLAGDVRARWTCTGERVNGQSLRGFNTVKGTPNNRYRSEMNLFLDYETPISWVSTKLKWSAFLGKDSGSETKTDLERAFIGYDIYHEGDRDFYIELGRSKLDFIFDSRVMFSSFFDGIHLYYTDRWAGIGTFVIHGGPFIVDTFSNHYAWIVETFINKWMGTGISFKYSIIDWYRGSPTKAFGQLKLPKPYIKNNPRYHFIVSQMMFGYEKKIDFLGCKTMFAYGAVLCNHFPLRSRITEGRKLNGAWYAGFTLGKLCKACDWSFDINYQWVQAQAFPEFDLCGIGHGNSFGLLLSDAIITGTGSPFNAQGFLNYRGWQISLLYALTDTLSLRAKAEWSRPINRSIGGSFFYKNAELAAIYAF